MITTWNLQGVSTRDRIRNRLKRVVAHAKAKNWEIVIISEIKAADGRVIWYLAAISTPTWAETVSVLE